MVRNAKPRLTSRSKGTPSTTGVSNPDVVADHGPKKKAATQKISSKKPVSGKDSKNIVDVINQYAAKNARLTYDYEATPGETKKLTKAEKQSIEAWSGEQKHKVRDAWMAGMLAANKEQHGHEGVFQAKELQNLTVGIPMPCLALEFLFKNDCWPLSTLAIINGDWGSCKSAFLFEIYRWFADCNGGGFHYDVESKMSHDLFCGILRINPQQGDDSPVIVHRVKSMEDWQRRLTFDVKLAKKRMIGTKDEPGPGRTIPICFGIDSVSGKGSEEIEKKMLEKGTVGREFPAEALFTSRYLKHLPQQMDNWPFSVVFISQLTQDMAAAEGGRPSRSGDGKKMPGPSRTAYQETYEIRNEVWKSKINTANFDGIGIRMRCSKNALGETGKSIRTRMIWWDDEIGVNQKGLPIYHTKYKWDWNWATVNMLYELDEKFKKRLKRQGFVLNVKSPTADVECEAQCDALGMGKEFASWNRVGGLIHSNPEIMAMLRNELRIIHRPIMQGNYIEQIDSLRGDLP